MIGVRYCWGYLLGVMRKGKWKSWVPEDGGAEWVVILCKVVVVVCVGNFTTGHSQINLDALRDS